MILASTQLTGGMPTVRAILAVRGDGQFACEQVYVTPTPGVDAVHTPIPEGPLEVRFWARRDAGPTLHTVHWPGLGTGVSVGDRVHHNIILQITKEET